VVTELLLVIRMSTSCTIFMVAHVSSLRRESNPQQLSILSVRIFTFTKRFILVTTPFGDIRHQTKKNVKMQLQIHQY